MASNYSSIRADNERRYGTDIDRIGKMLLANLYADQTHFIFELLQNAEDAMGRRGRWQRSRAVRFALSKRELRVVHFGEPFDERDVRAICNIAVTTKDLTDIGRFGIGFKSVYAFTDMPEVHSGEENFAIEKYVLPAPAKAIERQPDETVFLLPLRTQDTTAVDDVTDGLRKLGPQTLLFLRQIDEIAWSVGDGPSGLYLRSEPETIGENVRRITVIGQEEGRPDIEETWLVFSRSTTKTDAGPVAGQVEIAFSVRQDKESRQQSVQALNDSPLVVFFPTVVQTHLGFLVQGPYHTTPSRDNVPRNDPWNQDLVKETAALLGEALRSLRDLGFLDVSALSSLPLDRTRFGEGQMFAPLFEAVRSTLASEHLLPRFDDGHICASRAKLARTQELRELFSPTQLATLFAVDGQLPWLSEGITQDRTPELRRYLMEELDIAEVTPETVLPMLNKAFLEAQSDEWILSLYEFLNGRLALHRRLEDVPLVRLADGPHVKPKNANGQPQAFLPSAVETGFPTVKASVCGTDEAREFLESLSLREPDPVDDVVVNILPKYEEDQFSIGDEEYRADIRRMLAAFQTDSKSQRDKLTDALRETHFVKAVDAGDGAKPMAEPARVYLATQRLKVLFEGVGGVLLVDDSYECLRGEEIRELLEACGATRYLRPVPVQPSFTYLELQEMRRKAGCERNTAPDRFDDNTLFGLKELLAVLRTLEAEPAANKAKLLWEVLADLQDRRGQGVFSGRYWWFYHTLQNCEFDATFVQQLNKAAWVPTPDGTLQSPGSVLFEETGWKANPFLLSKIRFNPPVVEQLAKEAGIEFGVIALLKQLGLTSEEELKARLGIKEETLEGAAGQEAEGTTETEPVTTRDSGTQGAQSGLGGDRGESSAKVGRQRGTDEEDEAGTGRPVSSRRQGRFCTYVRHDGPEPGADSDETGAQQSAVEKAGVRTVMAHERDQQREPEEMPPNHPGYDIESRDGTGVIERYIEVKACSGAWGSLGVGLTKTEFERAREFGDRYWLYVIENAVTDSPRIHRIQDPAQQVNQFFYDHGWAHLSEEDQAPC